MFTLPTVLVACSKGTHSSLKGDQQTLSAAVLTPPWFKLADKQTGKQQAGPHSLNPGRRS